MTDSWSLTAPIRNSIRGRTEFYKITMTLGRHNLHFPTPALLLIFDRRPPPRYKFLSAIKIKDGGHNFHQGNTEHSLAKITPALQASHRLDMRRNEC